MNKLISALCLVAISSCGGGTPSPLAAAGDANTTVADIQGNGVSSPLLGQSVTFVAVVSGDFQDHDADTSSNLGGFYVQAEVPDDDPASSDGVFVYDGDESQQDVNPGDKVRITGIVKEHFGETQVHPTSVSITGSAAVRVTDIELPTSAVVSNSDGDLLADLERFEGMLVRLPQALQVSNLRSLDQFGEVGLSQGGRLQQFTNAQSPGVHGYQAHATENASRYLILDDGLRSSNPDTIRFLNAGKAADYSLRAGDSVTGLTGNLRYARGSGARGAEGWRLMPTADVSFNADNPRPEAPARGGDTRVASFNVLNFFSRIDSGQPICGPRGKDNCRGADSKLEQSRQLAKITTALTLLDADVIALIELENNAQESLEMIVRSLNERAGSERYAYVDTGTVLDDAIKTALLYDQSTMQLSGSFALLDSTVDARFDDQRNRPALAQSFTRRTTGAIVTVVVNHLKSKGSDCAADNDPNTGDGQGNCNLTRTRAAAALADWIQQDPTDSGDPDVLVLGDLNAYLFEDPLRAMKEAGLVNVLERLSDPYTFLYDAQIGALDHALLTPSLAPQVENALAWHINADEPPVLDYNLEYGRDPGLFDANSPYRSSDHDPVVIDLKLSD